MNLINKDRLMKSFADKDILEIIAEQHPVKAVPLSVLQEIRQEIEQSKQYKGQSGNPYIDVHDVGLDRYFDLGLTKALNIIDRHLKEYME